MRGLVGVCVVLGAVATGALGQGMAAPSGTVTGRLTFAETQLPARFAEVVLVRVPDAGDLLLTERPQDPKKQLDKVVSVSGRSGLDGTYTIPLVPPGDYFAIAKFPGYAVPIVPPKNEKDVDDLAKLTAQLPVVHVTENAISTMDLTLHRGAVISGRVVYQDGSPVAGVYVQAISAETGDWVQSLTYQPLQQALGVFPTELRQTATPTDDDGHFRLSGLAPGKYLIFTMIQTGGGYITELNGPSSSSTGLRTRRTSNIILYMPGSFTKGDAKVVDIRGDEYVGDADIVVDLNGLHDVRGRVFAKSDRHVPSFVVLMLGGEGKKSFQRVGQVDENGSFRLEAVPPGKYTLTVAADDFPQPARVGAAAQSGSGPAPRRFERVKVPVIVGDHDVELDDVLVVEAKPPTDGATVR